jgi:hypothetical protein
MISLRAKKWDIGPSSEHPKDIIMIRFGHPEDICHISKMISIG